MPRVTPVPADPQPTMELPQAVIAQAEAAAASNQAEPRASPAPKQGHQELGENLASSSSGGNTLVTSLNPDTMSTQVPAFQQAARETSIEEVPPPAYGETYGQIDFSQDGFDTGARVGSDGRVNIDINQKSRRLSDLLVPALRSQLNLQHVEHPPAPPPGYIPPALGGRPGQAPPPPMNVVIHVVGSRGDVQPFIALGKVLKATYGHRVRLATHPTFRGFVEENGLEFFSISGDPAELMAFMVKNPGLMPGMETLRNGDTGKRRKGIYEIVQGCWRSCIEVGDGTGIKASDHHVDSHLSLGTGTVLDGDSSAKPFVADAIIANPPSFAHVHCAEKLGIPLHLMFTMPWSPTQAFPHPLTNIHSSNADANLTNFISYALVEMITWQGLGDVINRFRERSLGLEPVSLMWAPGMASRLRIPYTYCWSPALIPKPKDWGPHISVSGFYFLTLANDYTPGSDLTAFLRSGPPPVYIGFGSIVVDDPTSMTKLIFEAIKKTGSRALVSKGWGGLGADALGIPNNVFMFGNVPHDWLFKHVSCVVHHGGAGTTAAGIALGKPTVIVPFFGDQPFWGAMVAKAGAGPSPIPSKQLTSDNLAAAILEALKPTTLSRAQGLGASIASETGTETGAQSFHDNLNVDSLRCTLAPSRTAVWRIKRTDVRLSAFTAATLGNEGLLDFNDLKLYRPREYEIEDGPWDPISGGASALLGTIGSLMMGAVDFPVEILKALKVKTSEKASPEKPLQNNASGSTLNTRLNAVSSSGLEAFEKVSSEEDALSSSRSSTSDRISDHSHPTPASRSIAEGKREPSRTLSDASTAAAQAGPGTSGAGNTVRSSQGSMSRLCHRRTSSRGPGESPSRSGSNRSSIPEGASQHHHRTTSGTQAGQISLDAALGAGKGVGRMVEAGLKSPMDFTLSIARGFHNAPKLYGDQSVRPSEKITGIQSGLRAAGKEFGFGLYDGISGLVTQPLDGAKKEGVAGLIKGFGKGIGGVVLKPSAAIWGIPGYTFKGIYKELQKHLGSSVQNYIVAARTAQGYEEWMSSGREERLDVISRWHATQLELSKGMHQVRHASFRTPQEMLRSRHTSYEERERASEDKKKQKDAVDAHRTQSLRSEDAESSAASVQAHLASEQDTDTDSIALEEAIQNSVMATSKGNPEEDRMIERAIRASIVELQLASGNGDGDDAVGRAIQASITEASKVRMEGITATPDQMDGISDHDRQLEATLRQSMIEQHQINDGEQRVRRPDSDKPEIASDDDENMKFAIEQSRASTAEKHVLESDKGLQKALKESKEAHESHEQGLLKAKTEEQIVLEYMKKQSEAEDQYPRSKQSDITSCLELNEAELQRAMKESLKLHQSKE